MKAKILNMTYRDPGWSGPCLLFWSHLIRYFPSFTIFQPTSLLSFSNWTTLPPYMGFAHAAPSIWNSFASLLYSVNSSYEVSVQPSFLQRNLRVKSGLSIRSVGPVAPFLQSNYNMIIKLHFFVSSFAQYLSPPIPCKDHIWGFVVVFLFCFFLTLTTVSPILA